MGASVGPFSFLGVVGAGVDLTGEAVGDEVGAEVGEDSGDPLSNICTSAQFQNCSAPLIVPSGDILQVLKDPIDPHVAGKLYLSYPGASQLFADTHHHCNNTKSPLTSLGSFKR